MTQRCMREPGIEPGPTPWQGAILPLDHSRNAAQCGPTAWSQIVPPAGLEPATFGLEVQRAIHCAKGAGFLKRRGSAVQVGPPAGWEPLLSSALQELSVARHLSCSVSGLARFSLPQAPSRQGLRQASSGHTRVTWAEHRHSAVQPWNPMEPTHSAPPLSLQEAGVSERCPPAPDSEQNTHGEKATAAGRQRASPASKPAWRNGSASVSGAGG
jgi:hypothetical protein